MHKVKSLSEPQRETREYVFRKRKDMICNAPKYI